MQIRPAFHGALLGLWLCLFISSFCYGDDKTIEVAGEPNKVFAEFKTTEAVELNEESKFAAVVTPKSFFKKPLLHKVPIVKKPFPPEPYFKKPPLHKIAIVKKPISSPVPDFKFPIPWISHPIRRLIQPSHRPGFQPSPRPGFQPSPRPGFQPSPRPGFQPRPRPGFQPRPRPPIPPRQWPRIPPRQWPRIPPPRRTPPRPPVPV